MVGWGAIFSGGDLGSESPERPSAKPAGWLVALRRRARTDRQRSASKGAPTGTVPGAGLVQGPAERGSRAGRGPPGPHQRPRNSHSAQPPTAPRSTATRRGRRRRPAGTDREAASARRARRRRCVGGADRYGSIVLKEWIDADCSPGRRGCRANAFDPCPGGPRAGAGPPTAPGPRGGSASSGGGGGRGRPRRAR